MKVKVGEITYRVRFRHEAKALIDPEKGREYTPLSSFKSLFKDKDERARVLDSAIKRGRRTVCTIFDESQFEEEPLRVSTSTARLDRRDSFKRIKGRTTSMTKALENAGFNRETRTLFWDEFWNEIDVNRAKSENQKTAKDKEEYAKEIEKEVEKGKE